MTPVFVVFVKFIAAVLLVQLVYVYVEGKRSFWLLDLIRAMRAASEYVKMVEEDLAKGDGGVEDEEPGRKEGGDP